jgi:itaconate CoA-transferase
MTPHGPLDGITVVSLEQAVAAPFTTRQLADLGARVIKVERPGTGDFARGYDDSVKGLSSYFVWLNRGKESLTLDVKHPRGAAVLARLIGSADVVVQNLAPGSADRLGLSAARLRSARPDLIVCGIQGYASDGPYADRRAYDLLIQSEAGLVSVTGTPTEPGRVGASVADIAGGMYGFASILTALYRRERTGEGASLEVSLFESLTEWMAQPMYYAMYSGVAPARSGTDHATIAPYGTYRTADGGVQFSIQNGREWQRLCADVLEQPWLAGDPRFATNVDRVANRVALRAEIERALASMTSAEAIRRLTDARVANGAYNTVIDLLGHPQLEAGWREIDSPVGPLRALRPPIRIEDATVTMGDVPDVGSHTGAILAELGYGRADVDELRVAGVI